MTTAISLAVIDDHPLFREGVVRSLVEIGGFSIVGEGSTKDDAVRIVAESRPDVLLMDISMPGGGLEAIPLILEHVPDQKIVMLTVSEASDDVTTALRSGAKGYVLKGVGSRTLAEILRTVASGETYVAPTLSARLISGQGAAPAKADLIRELTDRESEVLQLVATGLSNKQIGLKLDLHEKTVKHHMTQIFTKLGVANRTEAAMVFRDALERNG
ncbi:response regulator transcription factor [Agrobacterium sp. SHOUNA12C]|uniref:Two-component response regulator protein n=2 Tax=Rhizobium rhizogenes TaxID=359 RepID=B9JJX6_RHIR8|nr:MULTISPECIES: response regulator transcription factor [Rhizobium]ACM30218.1 two-component response regulator protein [Rhizobium rhizogenes K84]KAA6488422.1 DNA-binding response regulator [Agrobacterium sp. ICMP 7243]MCJ9719456.1 response regulator transcription factor [Agrobacterium sp. BETTINA12B]MCJ9755694.1 response regulator transcription factor [Agrobacterium sp. SHOUNA12C]OCJ01968.1 DNA-binding response regulator [Agrobacterium sp. 13-626]OCJ10576.1 DNA-binding response regulator [Ag